MSNSMQGASTDIADNEIGHCPETLTDMLESSFRLIQQTRMHDVPILNHALAVEAVSFHEWNGNYLGVLITPWFMNLMLLPGEPDTWQELKSGENVTHIFPSGTYEFIIGEAENIGRYQMCSLFSPMFEFRDHQSAVATAKEVMIALMDENNLDTTSTREKEMQRIWCGEAQKGDGADATEYGILSTIPAKEPGRKSGKSLKEKINRPMTRRDLLRGSFLKDDQ